MLVVLLSGVSEHDSPVWGCGWSLIRGELHAGDLNSRHKLIVMGDLDSDIGDNNIEYAGDCAVGVVDGICCCCS